MADEEPFPKPTEEEVEEIFDELRAKYEAKLPDMAPHDLYVNRDDPSKWTEEAINDVLSLAKLMWADLRIFTVLKCEGEARQLNDVEEGIVSAFEQEFYYKLNRHVPYYNYVSRQLVYRMLPGHIEGPDTPEARAFVVGSRTGYLKSYYEDKSKYSNLYR